MNRLMFTTVRIYVYRFLRTDKICKYSLYYLTINTTFLVTDYCFSLYHFHSAFIQFRNARYETSSPSPRIFETNEHSSVKEKYKFVSVFFFGTEEGI